MAASVLDSENVLPILLSIVPPFTRLFKMLPDAPVRDALSLHLRVPHHWEPLQLITRLPHNHPYSGVAKAVERDVAAICTRAGLTPMSHRGLFYLGCQEELNTSHDKIIILIVEMDAKDRHKWVHVDAELRSTLDTHLSAAVDPRIVPLMEICLRYYLPMEYLEGIDPTTTTTTAREASPVAGAFERMLARDWAWEWASERQRHDLARAHLSEPPLLVLTEPSITPPLPHGEPERSPGRDEDGTFAQYLSLRWSDEQDYLSMFQWPSDEEPYLPSWPFRFGM